MNRLPEGTSWKRLAAKNSKGGVMARILIAEDDGALRCDMEGVISGWGYDVRTAAAGLQAFRLMKEWRPHLVISDINMPHVTGFDLVRYNNSLKSENAEVTIFLVSGQIPRGDPLELGADAFIQKPINYKKLKLEIERQLNEKIERLASALMN